MPRKSLSRLRFETFKFLDEHPTASPEEVVRAIAPSRRGAAREALLGKVQGWQAARGTPQGEGAAQAAKAERPVPRVTRALVGAGRVDQLMSVLGDLLDAFKDCMRSGDFRGAATVTGQITKVQNDLEEARSKEARQGASLDKSPRAVAAWLKRNQDDIELLANRPGRAL